MTVDEKIQSFLHHFNYDVPNPEHEPIRFAYYLKLWKYYVYDRQS